MIEKTKISVIDNTNILITAELYNKLRTVFPKKEITPGVSIEELMYSGGEQNVLDYLARYIRNSGTSTDPKDIVKVDSIEPGKLTRNINLVKRYLWR